MRTDLELLKLVLKQYKSSVVSGLCHEVDWLLINEEIDEKEHEKLGNYLINNAPAHVKHTKISVYWWKPYNARKPRIAWLKYHIKKLSKNLNNEN